MALVFGAGMRRSVPFILFVTFVACGGSSGTTIPDGREHSEDESLPADPGETPVSTPPASATSSPSERPETPDALACVAGHYVGAPAPVAKGWALRLPDASELVWDDGAAKTFDQKIAAPDIEDTLAIPYTIGKIVPVTKPNHDPGRVRSDALFRATFGATEAAVRAQLVDVDFVGQKVKFHSRAAAALGRVSAALTKLVASKPSLGTYVKGEIGGTFAWRPIVNTDRLSAHSYGIAIDIVTSRSDYWEWDKQPDGSFEWNNRIPQAIVDAFEAEGFIWGGRWYHYDTMHFENRPELFDEACQP